VKQLLSTKLHTPSIQPEFVPRPELVERLNDGLERKLILISASAGFGKTTLVADWCRQADHSITWLSLDKNDNDPIRFFGYLIAALQKIDPEICRSAQSILHSPQPLNLEPVLVNLINEISETLKPFFLILDDYHVIETPELHQAVSFLLDHAPNHMHMTILTRSDPPLPIARLRGKGQLTELHTADLRFNADETESFLIHRMDLPLSNKEVISLKNRTEGWIVGLQLAALSLQGHDDKSAFIHAFTGSQRFILDYLTEDVLKLQANDIQTFLLQTSVLERLSGPLCNAVTGKTDSQRILEWLESNNLFLIPLDEERKWYRYHHLFADLLVYYRQRNNTLSAADLHRRASAWFEQKGLIIESVSHALESKDFDQAAYLILQSGWEILARGEMATLLSWMDLSPKDFAQSHPQLCVLYAWALAKSGHLDEVEACLQRIKHNHLDGEVAAVRAYVAGVRGDLSRAIELAQHALEDLPEENLYLRAIVTQNLGVTYHWSGNPAKAGQTLMKAIKLSRMANQTSQVVTAMAILGRTQEMQAMLRKAMATYQEARDLVFKMETHAVPFLSMAYVGLARILYEQNHLDRALHNAEQGTKLSEQGGFVPYQIFGYVLLAQIYLAKSDCKLAEEMLQKAENLGKNCEYRLVIALVTELRVRQWLAHGNQKTAVEWAYANWMASINAIDAAGEIEQIVVTRVLLFQEKIDEALNLLAQLLEIAQTMGRMESVLKILILQSLAFQSQGQINAALSILTKVLSLAEAEGYIRAFVDEGKSMESLLRLAQTRGISSAYVRKLLTVFQEIAYPSLTNTQLIDPLSDRELEVLRLIADGLSNREIADELVVAISTIKTHVNHIYRKLEVNSRTQAVAKSQQLDLI
jgi:LuxR family maltose regulon positive regulatory protein